MFGASISGSDGHKTMKEQGVSVQKRYGVCTKAALRLLPLFVLLFVSQPGTQAAPEQRPLRTVREIQQLGTSHIGQSYPVELQGIITYYDSVWKILFVQDSTGAVFISLPSSSASYPPFSRIRLDADAVISPTGPYLTHPAVHLLGSTELPPAHSLSLSDLNAGAAVSEFVSTEGVLRPCYQFMDRVCYQIYDGRSMAWVIMPHPPDFASLSLIGSTVRLKGVCGIHVDASGKMGGVQIYLNRLEDVEKTDNAPVVNYTSPASPISSLRLAAFNQRFLHPVHVRGRVTWESPGQAVLQDASGSTSVKAFDTSTLHPGDLVDVVGYPGDGELTPVTLYNSFVFLAPNSSKDYIAPRDVTAFEIVRLSLYGYRVRLKARLVGHDNRASEQIYYFSAGKESFSARLFTNGATSQMAGLPNGSYVELTGVAAMRRENVKPQESFQLLLQSPSDIAVDRNGWFSIQHLLVVAGTLVAFVFAVLIWVVMLRRTVRKQTEIIRASMESELQLATQYQRLFERNLAPVFRWRPDGSFIDFNMAFIRLMGFNSREELADRSYWDFEADPEEREELRKSLLKKEMQSNRDTAIRRVDGSHLHLLMNITPVDTPKGTIYETTAIDISDLQHRQVELQRARDAAVVESLQDPLTGLPNRRMVTEKLSVLMDQTIGGGLIGLLFIDLDGFKVVNDTFGHSIGDVLLVQVAERLRKRVRQFDIVARQGGDEFMVILKDIRAEEETERIAASLLKALFTPFRIEGNEITISGSIGISIYPESAADAEALIRQADCAMYAAKRDGKNRLTRYTPEIGAQFQEESLLRSSTRSWQSR